MSADQPSGISGIGVAAVFAGGILLWSGIKGVAVSAVFRDLIAGKSPAGEAQTTAVDISSLLGQKRGVGGDYSLKQYSGQGSGSNTQNARLGKKMAAAYGWNSGAEWAALNAIVMAESGWSTTAQNASGAAGIAQKISGFSSNYQKGNAPQQIAWLLQYIRDRYGDPISAWRFHQTHGWY